MTSYGDTINLVIARLANYALCYCGGYPAFEDDYLRRVVYPRSTSPGELAEYLRSRRCPRLRVVFLLLVVLLCLRSILYPAVTFATLDLTNYGANIKTSRAHNNNELPVHQFACLATNCTRLAPKDSASYEPLYDDLEQRNTSMSADERLARDFFRLPHFTLCYPSLSRFHDYPQYWEHYGLCTSSIISLGVLLSALIMPLIASISSDARTFLMFILTPRLSRRIVLARIRCLLLEVSTSHRNYCLAVLRKQLQRRHRGAAYRLKTGPVRTDAAQAYPQLLADESLRCQDDLSVEGSAALERFVFDCMPAARTDWWWSRILYAFASTVVTANFNFYLVVGLAYSYVPLVYMPKRRQYLADTAREIRNSNCAIWYSADQGGSRPGATIDLGAIVMQQSWLFVVPTMVNMCTLFCANLFCINFYATMADIFCWLYEVQLKLDVAIEFAHHVNCSTAQGRRPRQEPPELLNSWSLSSSPLSHLPSSGLVNMESLCSEFEQCITLLNSIVFYSTLVRHRRANYKSTALEHKFAVQELVSRQLARADQSDLDAQAELLTKLYINFRLFVEQIRIYEPLVACLVLAASVLNYGYCFESVWLAKRIRGFALKPIYVTCLFWFVANFFILIPSNFHAKTRKLHTQIWSLLALTGGSRDTRIEHLRLLWLKQMSGADKGGGIAFTWFRMRITYVNIIQMMIWTATIIVVSLRV